VVGGENEHAGLGALGRFQETGRRGNRRRRITGDRLKHDAPGRRTQLRKLLGYDESVGLITNDEGRVCASLAGPEGGALQQALLF
jgi:hypothetical protein